MACGLGRIGAGAGWRPVCWILAAGAGLSLVSALARPQDILFWSLFGAFSGLCAFPVVAAWRRSRVAGADRRDADLLAPAGPFFLVFFVLFGLGSVYGWTGLDQQHDHPNPLPGLVLAAVGLGAFAIGYHLPVVSRTRSIAGRLPRWRPRRALLAALLCATIGIAGAVAAFSSTEYFFGTQSNISVDLSSPLGFLQELLFVGLCMLAIVAGSSLSRRRAQVLLLLVAGAVSAALLPTGHRFYLFIVLGSIGIPWHYYIQRIRLSWMAALAAFTILALNPVGQLWRTEYHAQAASGPGDIPTVAAGVAQDLASMTGSSYLDYAIGQRFERLNEAATVSALLNTVPSVAGYKYGATYLPMVTWVVPRFFWPNKPTFQFFNDIGRATGLIGPNDNQTTVVYTSIGELYLNFGYPGVPIGMFALGMLFRWLYQALMSGPRNETAVLAYSLLVFPFWSVEEALGPALGGAIRDVVAGLLLLLVCGALVRETRQRRTPEDRWGAAAARLPAAPGSVPGPAA